MDFVVGLFRWLNAPCRSGRTAFRPDKLDCGAEWGRQVGRGRAMLSGVNLDPFPKK